MGARSGARTNAIARVRKWPILLLQSVRACDHGLLDFVQDQTPVWIGTEGFVPSLGCRRQAFKAFGSAVGDFFSPACVGSQPLADPSLQRQGPGLGARLEASASDRVRDQVRGQGYRPG